MLKIKKIILVFVVALSLVLCSCADKQNAEDTKTNTRQKADEQKTPEVVIDKSLPKYFDEIDDLSLIPDMENLELISSQTMDTIKVKNIEYQAFGKEGGYSGYDRLQIFTVTDTGERLLANFDYNFSKSGQWNCSVVFDSTYSKMYYTTAMEIFGEVFDLYDYESGELVREKTK